MTPAVFYSLYSLAIILLIFWIGKWVIHILAIVYAKYRLHRKTQLQPNEKGYPGVTILKPLMGVDPHLVSNLETFFTMNYPLYEIHFCIEDENDPAVDVAIKLQERFPNVTAKIFTGGSNIGVNPKINNMHNGYTNGNHPLILISDSGIRMKEDTLLDMVNHMKDDVGLVHQLPFTCDRGGFAGTLEKVYFGTAQARIYLAADLLGINCHTGMSTLVRKNLIDEVGGLEAFSNYLAEDYFLAKSLTDRGWKMTISSQPAWQNSGICEVSFFQARLRRWVKLRIAMVPLTLLFEPLSECLVLGAATSWAVYFILNWDPILFYLVHILVWFFCDWILLSLVQNGTLPFNKFDFVISWVFREACSPYLFIKALLNPRIKWRTRTYKLKWGGIAEECKV